MKTYWRQQPAFDALQPHQCIFQNQSEGKRYYVVGTNEEYWTKYLAKGDRYGYEVIQRGKPCHLHVDLDVNREKYPGIKVMDVWSTLEKHIDHYLVTKLDISKESIT